MRVQVCNNFQGLHTEEVEYFDDGFPVEPSHNGWLIKLQARREKQKTFDFKIDTGDENPEEDEEANEPEEYEEINLVDKFNFYDCEMDLKAFVDEIKNLMKLILPKVKEDRPDDEADFKKTMKELVGEIQKNFKDYKFYRTGEICYCSFAICHLPESKEPTFYFFRHTLRDFKC